MKHLKPALEKKRLSTLIPILLAAASTQTAQSSMYAPMAAIPPVISTPNPAAQFPLRLGEDYARSEFFDQTFFNIPDNPSENWAAELGYKFSGKSRRFSYQLQTQLTDVYGRFARVLQHPENLKKVRIEDLHRINLQVAREVVQVDRQLKTIESIKESSSNLTFDPGRAYAVLFANKRISNYQTAILSRLELLDIVEQDMLLANDIYFRDPPFSNQDFDFLNSNKLNMELLLRNYQQIEQDKDWQQLVADQVMTIFLAMNASGTDWQQVESFANYVQSLSSDIVPTYQKLYNVLQLDGFPHNILQKVSELEEITPGTAEATEKAAEITELVSELRAINQAYRHMDLGAKDFNEIYLDLELKSFQTIQTQGQKVSRKDLTGRVEDELRVIQQMLNKSQKKQFERVSQEYLQGVARRLDELDQKGDLWRIYEELALRFNVLLKWEQQDMNRILELVHWALENHDVMVSQQNQFSLPYFLRQMKQSIANTGLAPKVVD